MLASVSLKKEVSRLFVKLIPLSILGGWATYRELELHCHPEFISGSKTVNDSSIGNLPISATLHM
jgi:hypothetical protein